MKRKILNFIFAFIFIAGFIVAMFPSICNQFAKYNQNKEKQAYYEAMKSVDNTDYSKAWKAAEKYNKQIKELSDLQKSTSLEKYFKGKKYDKLLDVSGLGIMGVIRIPEIDVSLPIYHGTSDGVLMAGAGHYQGSSLPIGGKGQHCVITGHTGVPTARLFTDLQKLDLGDVFYIDVLDKTLAYQVDNIKKIYPEELEKLSFNAKQDYCTLITCAPYGLNTERLCVRGHRITYVDIDSTMGNEVLYIPTYGYIAGALVIYAVIKVVKRRKKREN